MRKLRTNKDESLDLLLDTLCNVFGGIILISCLLSLLTQQRTPAPAAPSSLATAQGQLLAERLLAAQNELAGLLKLSSENQAAGQNPLQALIQERNELQAALDRLRKLQPADTNSDTSLPKERVGDLTELRAEVRALEQKIADAKARKQAADAKGRDLAGEIDSIRNQTAAEDEKRVEHVRFPKERASSKPPFHILLKYGALYPLQDAAGDKFPGITRVPKNDEAYEAIPKKSEGIPITDRATIRRILASFQRWGGYASLDVYPDSFETFRSLRLLILEAHLDYGFEVFPEHYIITFSPKGTSPSPL